MPDHDPAEYDAMYDVRPLDPAERLTVCTRCGVVVADRSEHDLHHSSIDQAIHGSD